MIKFSKLAPAPSIKAADLDQNFREAAPAEDQDLRHVRIRRGQDGFRMEIFPDFPAELGLLSSAGSQPFWLTVSELLTELVAAGLVAEVVDQINNGGTVSAGAISGGINSAPPSGTPDWRQVERCDGQTMYVWGTEWE